MLNTKSLVFVVTLSVVTTAFLIPLIVNTAYSKITEEPTGSENPAGKEAPGQQPEAKGKGQTQFTENQNPTGKAPPGQNK